MSDKHLLAHVPDDVAFVCKSGRKLHTIQSLIAYLHSVSKSEFSSHVTSDRNDYANWIEFIFGAKHIAHMLQKESDARIMADILSDELHKARVDYKETEEEIAFLEKKVEQQEPPKAHHHVTKPKAVERDDEEPINMNIHDQIKELEKHLTDLTRYKTHTPRQRHVKKEEVGNLKEQIFDFAFGFIIGIVVGMLIAKAMGIF